MFEQIPEISIKAILEGFLGNMLWVIIGGGLALLIKTIFNRIQKIIVEARQSISGEYISFYEDEDDESKKIWRTAPVTIHQSGYNINGVTEFDKKRWSLKGEISEGKYLYGMYWSDNPHDPGTGNYFLKIENTIHGKIDSLRGIWSGYDADNHKITSGQYIFRKKYSPKVGKHKSASIPAMVEIAENQLGKSYISDEDFTNNKNMVLRASIGNETVGFSIVTLLAKDEFATELKQIADSEHRSIGHAEVVGLIKSVAVAESYKQRGIGDTIIKASMDELILSGANILVMVGWKSKLGTNIESLALLNGFRPVCELSKYWSEDSVIKKYSCPVCGKPPCACSAVIFTKHVEA